MENLLSRVSSRRLMCMVDAYALQAFLAARRARMRSISL